MQPADVRGARDALRTVHAAASASGAMPEVVHAAVARALEDPDVRPARVLTKALLPLASLKSPVLMPAAERAAALDAMERLFADPDGALTNLLL